MKFRFVRRRHLPRLALLAAATLLAGFVASQATGGENVSANNRTVALGIWVPGTPWDLTNLNLHESKTQKKNAIVNFFWSWDDASGPPDTQVFANIAAGGSVPMVTWMPQDYRNGTNQPQFRLSQILNGRYDTFITQWAQALASHNGPIFMRLAHEMNGNWYPWGHGVGGNTPEQYIAFWRHVHGIFQANGATNVKWVWAPNIDNSDPALFFPGDVYIDWVGLSLYNNADWGIWRSFAEWLGPTYNRVTSLTSKPLMIAEVGSGEGKSTVGGDKGQWIRDMYETAIPHQFPRIMAVLWFNENKAGVEAGATDYSLSSSPGIYDIYTQVVSSSVYVTSLSQLGSSPRPTPTSAPAATPTPTPSVTNPNCVVQITSGQGWSRFIAPCTGTTNVTVYLSQGGRFPVNQVINGSTYWVKGPVTIEIQ